MSREKTSGTRGVAAGMAAHLYAQGVTILTQLATLPIFLSRWSSEQYGQWIVLTAVPLYLSLADFGIVTAAGNMMTMHRARGEMDELNRVFRASILIVAVCIPVIALLFIVPVLSISWHFSQDQRYAMAALIMASLLNVACGLFDSAYRPFGKYPKVTVLLTSARVMDWAGSITGLIIGGTLTTAALGLLAGRLISCLVIFVMARRDVPEVEWKLRDPDGRVDRTLIRTLLRSGVGFMSFPIGNLLTLQGMVVLVGAQLGGTAVAQFNTSRTLARLLAQLAILTGKSMSPEISRLYGAGRDHDAESLIRRLMWTILPLTIVGAVVLSLLAPYIFQLWSHGKIEFERTVFSWLLVGAVASAYWQIRSTKLTATNRHSMLAMLFLIVSALSLVLAWLLGPRFGTVAAAACTCLIEVCMVVVTLWAIARIQRLQGARR